MQIERIISAIFLLAIVIVVAPNSYAGPKASFSEVAACTFSLAPINQSFPATGGTAAITITSSEPQCAWSARSNVPWITVSSTSGTGTGAVNITVLPTTSARNGTVIIAGQAFTVYQSLNPCATPSFALPAPMLPMSGLSNFVAGDFNGDGRVDAVTLSYSSQYALSFAAGNRSGGFDVPRSGPLGFEPRTLMALKAEDFNNDGKLDLLFIDGAPGLYYVLLGDGAGGFGAPRSFAASTANIASETASQTVIADVNNDRNLDIIGITEFGSGVTVTLGDGKGNFNATPTIKPATITFAKVVGAGDFTGDGQVDLIYLENASYRFLLMPGNGMGGFGAGTAISYVDRSVTSFLAPEDLAVGDVNGDGKLDLVVTSSLGLFVVSGNGAGGFGEPVRYLRDTGGGNVLINDFDGDGRADIVVVSNQELIWLRGLGGGQFADPARFLGGKGENRFTSPYAFDVNKDGVPDLLFTTPTAGGVLVVLGNRGTGFVSPQGQPVGLPIERMVLADFNGDGLLDLAATYGLGYDNSGFAVAFGNGSGGFGQFTNYLSGRAVTLLVTDFNLDGKPDLLLNTSPDSGVFDTRSWLNNGSGGFTLAQTIPTNSAQFSTGTADFNNDGKPDLIIPNVDGMGLRLLIGNGNGTFTTLVERIQVGLNFDYVTGDFNGDGNADLGVWSRNASSGTGEVIILSGDGRGGLTESTRVAFSRELYSLTTADFNGDGRADLLGGLKMRDESNGVAIALANAGGGFAPPVGYSSPELLEFLVADFNNDGKPDVASSSGGFLFTNRGDGSFDGPARFNTGGRLAIGDVNRDGTNDLLLFRLSGDAGNLFFIPNTARCLAANTAASVSAASYKSDGLAPDSIAALFGSNLTIETQTANSLPLPTTLAGTSLKLKDSFGIEYFAPLFFVSPGQINYAIPPGVAPGAALLTVLKSDGTTATGTLPIATVAPGLFTADATGTGYPSAVVLRVKADGSQSFEPVATFDQAQNKFVPRPIDLGPETDQIFLLLFGTGIRGRSSLDKVVVKIGGVDAPVLYAGQQGDFVGLDQVNLRLPRSLAGLGDAGITLTVEGKPANLVSIRIK